MRRACRVMMLLALVAVMAAPLAAQEKKKGKKGRKNQERGGVLTQLMKQVEKAEPTAEQKEKIKEITGKVEAELKELQAAVKLTPEQLKAQREARAKAEADGVKGKEMRDAVDAAMNLTEEQKAVRAKFQKQMAEVRQQIVGLLSAEQVEKAGLKVGRRGGGKKRNKDG